MYSPNLKSVALPVPEIGVPKKIWTIPGYAHALFSPKFLTGFYSEWPYKYIPKFDVRSFTCSSNKRGSSVANPQSRGRGGHSGSGMVLFERVFASFLLALSTYYSSIITRLPEILDCSFQWGLRTPDFGEGEAVGGRGWYRSKERW